MRQRTKLATVALVSPVAAACSSVTRPPGDGASYYSGGATGAGSGAGAGSGLQADRRRERSRRRVGAGANGAGTGQGPAPTGQGPGQGPAPTGQAPAWAPTGQGLAATGQGQAVAVAPDRVRRSAARAPTRAEGQWRRPAGGTGGSASSHMDDPDQTRGQLLQRRSVGGAHRRHLERNEQQSANYMANLRVRLPTRRQRHQLRGGTPRLQRPPWLPQLPDHRRRRLGRRRQSECDDFADDQHVFACFPTTVEQRVLASRLAQQQLPLIMGGETDEMLSTTDSPTGVDTRTCPTGSLVDRRAPWRACKHRRLLQRRRKLGSASSSPTTAPATNKPSPRTGLRH